MGKGQMDCPVNRVGTTELVSYQRGRPLNPAFESQNKIQTDQAFKCKRAKPQRTEGKAQLNNFITFNNLKITLNNLNV